MIRNSLPGDFEAIYTIINNAAVAYKGVIPDDRWHDPYMTRTELREQIESGVKFSCFCEDDKVLGVTGSRTRLTSFSYGMHMFFPLAKTEVREQCS